MANTLLDYLGVRTQLEQNDGVAMSGFVEPNDLQSGRSYYGAHYQAGLKRRFRTPGRSGGCSGRDDTLL